jgi:hypothetical protein
VIVTEINYYSRQKGYNAMDSNTLEHSKICHQALTKWYQLWMRGSMERKALVNELKTLITSLTESNSGCCHTFLWVEASGKVWKDLSFLDDCGVFPENEVSEDVLETSPASNLCFGRGYIPGRVGALCAEGRRKQPKHRDKIL